MGTVVLVVAVVVLFVLAPAGALAWGRSPRWDRPAPETPLDVLDAWGRELHLTMHERGAVERAVRRGERIDDPRLRPVVAAVANATVSIIDGPPGVRMRRVRNVVFPLVALGAAVIVTVESVLGHPGAIPVPAVYGVGALLVPVLGARRSRAVRRAYRANATD